MNTAKYKLMNLALKTSYLETSPPELSRIVLSVPDIFEML